VLRNSGECVQCEGRWQGGHGDGVSRGRLPSEMYASINALIASTVPAWSCLGCTRRAERAWCGTHHQRRDSVAVSTEH
jgi:hypothetical protein